MWLIPFDAATKVRHSIGEQLFDIAHRMNSPTKMPSVMNERVRRTAIGLDQHIEEREFWN
jgi:hypothetical protein